MLTKEEKANLVQQFDDKVNVLTCKFAAELGAAGVPNDVLDGAEFKMAVIRYGAGVGDEFVRLYKQTGNWPEPVDE